MSPWQCPEQCIYEQAQPYKHDMLSFIKIPYQNAQKRDTKVKKQKTTCKIISYIIYRQQGLSQSSQ